jgi:hypothetical protein
MNMRLCTTDRRAAAGREHQGVLSSPKYQAADTEQERVNAMKEMTWIIDIHSGDLTVEGLRQSELRELAADILPSGHSVNCARPINIEPLQNSSTRNSNGGPSFRVFRIYHNSVVEGPGRRSVLQTAGCLTQCDNFALFLKLTTSTAALK